MLIVICDAVLTVLCFVGAFKLRSNRPVLSETGLGWSGDFAPYSGILVFAVVVRLSTLAYNRVYRYHGAFAYTQEFIKIFKAVTLSSLLIVAWAFLFRGGFSFREFSYSRGVFALDFVFALAAFSLFHIGLRWIQSLVRERDINLIPTLVVGTNTEALQTILELRIRKYLGYRVLGVITGKMTHRDKEVYLDNGDPVPVLGMIDDLAEVIRQLRIQEVIIADNSFRSELLFDAMMGVGRSQKVEFRLAPSLIDLLPQKTSVEQIGVLPMVRLFREPLSDVQRFVKRTSDIVIASIAVALTSPLWLIIALLIKRDSPGPVFFRQERVGMDGRVFLCLKFRTMYSDADDLPHRKIYQKNIEGDKDANAGDSEAPIFGKVPDDPRITSVGKWLRRSSIDELPQLFNVLHGEMSVVGPRPPIPYEVEEYDLGHRKRLDMKPGITGLWQVSGRSRLTFEEMVRVDLYYIENWSIWLDMKILLLTFPAILRGDGAR
jgi:exopolysaccharide biosynthesis polyprenyl glycosylphosphotransferase